MQLTGSRPRCTLQYQSLVCIEKYLFNVGIRPICDKEIKCIFRPVYFFVRWIEYSSKYYKMNIIYTSVFNFFIMKFDLNPRSEERRRVADA